MIRAVMIWAAVLFWTVVGLTAAAQAQNSFGQAPQPQQQNQQKQGYQAPQQNNSRQGYPQQGQQGFGQPNAMEPQQQGGRGPLDQLAAMERRDFGVPPTARLHAGPMHGPTPASIPGGQLITTKGLVELLRGRQMPVLVLDVLGGQDMIPGAQFAVPAHQAGSFNDQVQQQFGQFLQGATGGNKEYPLVLYCLSPQCWMSYNAALRAINLGYTNVLWYRGGIESWRQSGQPTQPVPQPGYQ
ncbi:rhodanese-like domain-containing protein [Nitrococcus mobilis]|uniref:Rhodanese domain-containing protein n=1 Tax=Nitrococcus mobilis Nb-231 TaxID=314278 RepID=A4BLF5_9GAMM|nr:rhodanese-like domain-containing protein [Nitrococcus mobilis]EAR23143.1 hypothetical protein NB231_15023 [Nitrococcus mobilis Nb-231]